VLLWPRCQWYDHKSRENFFNKELLESGDDMDAQLLEHVDGPVPLFCPFLMVLSYKTPLHVEVIMFQGQAKGKVPIKLCCTITIVLVRHSEIRDLKGKLVAKIWQK
jgi:hypothetical protein